MGHYIHIYIYVHAHMYPSSYTQIGMIGVLGGYTAEGGKRVGERVAAVPTQPRLKGVYIGNYIGDDCRGS